MYVRSHAKITKKKKTKKQPFDEQINTPSMLR